MWLPHSFIILLLATLAKGSITNTTIDDSNSSFSFVGTWNTITPTSPCDFCSSKPNASLVHDGTWHDGNIRSGQPATTGSFTFQGSAVYIFGIDQTTSQPDIAFTLGNLQSVHYYTGTEQFVYNALFFSATGLAADQTHTVNWVFNIADTGVVVQAALFDYAIVTTGEEDAKSTTTKTTLSSQLPMSSSTHHSSSLPVSSQTSASATSQLVPTGLPQNQSSSAPVSLSTSNANPYHLPPSSTATVDGIITVTAESVQSAVSHTKSHLGAIIGAVIGALVVAALVILLLFFRSRRVRRMRPETDKAARSQFLRIEDYPLQSLRSTLPQADTREIAHPVPASLFASSSKREYLDTIPNTLGTSTASLLQAPPPLEAHIPTGSHAAQSSDPRTVPPPNGTAGRDLHFLEERLATLEAQVAVQQHPPPYVHEDD